MFEVRSITSVFPTARCLLVVSLLGLASCITRESSTGLYVVDFSQLPDDWSQSFLADVIVASNTGLAVDEVCYQQDFVNEPDRYPVFRFRDGPRGNFQAPNGGGGTDRRVGLIGGRDFTVVGPQSVVVETPTTGAQIVTLEGPCDVARRAKALTFRSTNSLSRKRCIIAGERLAISTGGATLDFCEVASVNTWSGPTP